MDNIFKERLVYNLQLKIAINNFNLLTFLQSDWIRQNCAVQMERVRENYNWQVQNLRDIRHYGSNQVGAVRDQYFDQVRNSSSSS